VRAGLACGLALLVLVLVALGLGGRRALATRAVLLWSAAILAVMLLAFVAWGVWQVHHDGFL
jgi:high-affinity Fe2+/Pb2+ permease